MPQQRFVIITGPVGGGKSTAAVALAERMKSESLKVAVIDLDVVYGMVRQRDGFGELELWPVARRASAALAATVFAQGYDCVILEGEFFSSEHLEQVRFGFTGPLKPNIFALNVSYAETLRRVRGDPSRGASKDPDLLRQFHEAFLCALPFLRTEAEIVDAECQPAWQVAARVAGHLAALTTATAGNDWPT